jgi:hypothetical protein
LIKEAIGLALGLALAGLLVHIGVWRLFRPRRQILGLALVFFVLTPALGLGIGSGCSGGLLLRAGMLYGLLAGAYVMTYPAVQAKSPTLEIIRLLGRSGMAYEEISRRFDDGEILEKRIEDLERDRWIVWTDGKPVLTSQARGLLTLMTLYRIFLGLPRGGG